MMQQRLSIAALALSFLMTLGCDIPPERPAPASDPISVDESIDPELDLVANNACGHTDQPCCGGRAHSFKGLAKRCSSKNTVCPQSESQDLCTPCGLINQPCCIVNNKPSCRDGSTCAHSVPGGPQQEAGSGICI
jgi:hypothetical protein